LPKSEIFILFNIIGTIIMVGIFLKKIISIRGRCLTCFMFTAASAIQKDAIMIKNIPAL